MGRWKRGGGRGGGALHIVKWDSALFLQRKSSLSQIVNLHDYTIIVVVDEQKVCCHEGCENIGLSIWLKLFSRYATHTCRRYENIKNSFFFAYEHLFTVSNMHGFVPSKDMQTPLPFRSGHNYMKDAHSAESKKNHVSDFSDFYFLSYGCLYLQFTVTH